MIPEEKKKDLEKQGYRLVGNHSAIKVCHWTKKSIRDEGVCYKKTFYGINTHRCVQMTPALLHCPFRCQWCWRDICSASPEWTGPVDEPKEIVDGCIKEHIRYLQGFGGNHDADPNQFDEAKKPLHFAISLAGEPTMYPKLNGLIDELKSRNMTSFLVTNGAFPNKLKNLKGHEPTQLYITLPAPNKNIFTKSCNPLIDNGWENILESVRTIKELNCRRTIRLTLAKGVNMVNPEEYAHLINDSDADFIELKAYMWVGYSRQRMTIENMPLHTDIMSFAKEVASHSDYMIVDEKQDSRVALLMKHDTPGRIMKF